MRDYIKIFGLGILLLLCIAYIGTWNLRSTVLLSFGYFITTYLPASLYFLKKNIPFIEKFVLINFIGISFFAAHVMLDVIFRIPLTTTTYSILSAVFLIGGVFVLLSDIKRKP